MWKWETDQTAQGVIVIIHGELEHHARYGWLIEMWRSKGYHVIMGDLPGQGMAKRTSRGHIDSFEQYIEEVQKWVEASYQFDLPVFILGHGMGGLIAVRMLQQMRLEIAGLILSSPTFALRFTPSKVSHVLSGGLNKFAPEHKFNFDFPIEHATRNKEIIDLDKEDSIYVHRVSVRWYREILMAMKQVPLENKNFPQIPVLLMQGGEDYLVETAVGKKWFRDLDLLEMHYKEWPQCYHELFNEPERDEIFAFTESFTRNRLRNIGYDV
ncbi:alpha/beta fold hydrolase [Jeotgalibacillus proteolyticus]|uniref:Phospholipase n=1 Tax=Jeotgalibacillus proteolyticus TaxID=2082395 RepID=A0A2S5GFB5_9BACL|nr:alpha/beta hydrolase [Jeotgalibacillus proteolyticus]PPA71737.1 phospholipase [Jeotgalibacillus proteolyticus]